MTPTEELRQGLAERGVKWRDSGMFHRTHWMREGIHYDVFEQGEQLYLQISVGPLTPAQVLAKTLGDANSGVGFDEMRYRRVCRLLEKALQTMTEWGCK